VDFDGNQISVILYLALTAGAVIGTCHEFTAMSIGGRYGKKRGDKNGK